MSLYEINIFLYFHDCILFKIKKIVKSTGLSCGAYLEAGKLRQNNRRYSLKFGGIDRNLMLRKRDRTQTAAGNHLRRGHMRRVRQQPLLLLRWRQLNNTHKHISKSPVKS